jgi:uncharacterized protein
MTTHVHYVEINYRDIKKGPSMTGIDQQIKDKIIALISALLPDAKIYLFGSRARGTQSQRSDIDIALDAGHRLPIAVVDEVKSVLDATNLIYTIDVLDLHFVSDAMRQSIMKERIIWKQ